MKKIVFSAVFALFTFSAQADEVILYTTDGPKLLVIEDGVGHLYDIGKEEYRVNRYTPYSTEVPNPFELRYGGGNVIIPVK